MEGLILALLLSVFLLAICRQKPGCLIPWSQWGAVVSAMVLALLIEIVRTHEGNHTGADPWMAAVVFLPSTALGIVVLKRDRFRRMALAAVLIGLSGLGYLWYIDHTNTMLSYTRWIQRGMP
jgi:TctA family transporter